MSESKRTPDPLPHGKTYEEIGEFWDTHSLADYWDQTHEVEFEVLRRHRVSVATDLYALLEEEAERQQVTPETMVNIILTEVLKSGGSKQLLTSRLPSQGVLAEEKAKYEAD